MQCLRCGKEIEETEVFCGECVALMAKHPVKPHTVVTIPERNIRDRNQNARKPQRTEENTNILERSVMQLRLWVCMLTVALLLCIGWISWQELRGDTGPAIGQNYTSIENQSQGGR